jgi:cytosine/adenosine deaminase-related metal-dependent hydrolase
VLGREREIGSLEPGKLADLVLWRLDGLGHSTIADPVAALVLGPPAPVTLSLVGGIPVVEDGRLTTADEAAIAREARSQARRLAELASR